MADYKIRKKAGYIIEGEKGTYELPPEGRLDFDDVSNFTEFNQSKDAKVRGEICKNFVLKYAPKLEEEGIGDFEYFQIFNDYNAKLQKAGE